MTNPDALANSQAPLPDLPVVPEEPLLPEEEETVEAREQAEAPGVIDDPIRGSFPAGGEQPETQGDEPLDAELGEDGEGDLAPGDEPDTSGSHEPTDLRGAAE
jgi:hypothetical protein